MVGDADDTMDVGEIARRVSHCSSVRQNSVSSVTSLILDYICAFSGLKSLALAFSLKDLSAHTRFILL